MTEEYELRIRLADYGSPAYREALKLRNSTSSEHMEFVVQERNWKNEEKSLHICAQRMGMVVGALLLAPKDGSARVDQLVVNSRVRNQDVAEQLLYFAEQVAIYRRFSSVWLVCHTRQRSFFESMGFAPALEEAGERITLKMQKELL